MEALIEEGRGPRVMVLENVCGTLTSHGGKDFVAIADAIAEAGYKFGAVVVDAAEFVPHSGRDCLLLPRLQARRYRLL
ncbi:MAG: DNA cytosine methyltransferase [Halioglobus sp.]